MNNVLGMLIGAAIDREDGDSGVGGAIGGYLAEGALKAIVPLAVTFAIGWGVQLLVRRTIESITGEPITGADARAG